MHKFILCHKICGKIQFRSDFIFIATHRVCKNGDRFMAVIIFARAFTCSREKMGDRATVSELGCFIFDCLGIWLQSWAEKSIASIKSFVEEHFQLFISIDMYNFNSILNVC